MGYTIVTAICLALLVAIVAYVIGKFAKRDRAGRIDYLRGFKKGQCAFVFLAAIPLYCAGTLYTVLNSGEINASNVFMSLITAVTDVVCLVVLKFDVKNIQPLMKQSDFYTAVVFILFILVIVNAILFAMSLFGQRIRNFFNRVYAFFTRKDKLIILGCNEDSVDIYKSDNKRRCKAIVGKVNKDDEVKLYAEKISYSQKKYDRVVEDVCKHALKRKSKCTVIINTQDEDENIRICRAFVAKIEKADRESKEKYFDKLSVYVFGHAEYEAIYNDIMENAHGCIHFANKYRMVANDFVDRYPLTRFMTGEQIDYSTAIIKDNVDINVFMIGFGKTNRRVFLTSVANNQFVKAGDPDPILKKVDYYIFDRDRADSNKNLNHCYYRYRNERDEMKQDDYLPFPTQPANEHYFKLDINHASFYDRIRDITSLQNNDANFVIIAFGTDLENIDLAQKLVEKRREWGVDFEIFVKVRSGKNRHNITEVGDAAEFHFFADTRESVYNIDKIMSDGIYGMAMMRHQAYELEYGITHGDGYNLSPEQVTATYAQAVRKWYINRSQIERDSNVFGVLSLRSKLNLMGLDYLPESDKSAPALTEKEYFDKYLQVKDGKCAESLTTNELKKSEQEQSKNKKSKSRKKNGESDYEKQLRKKIVEYPLDFATGTLRRALAVLEHHRWNSYMITKGIVPASIKQILTDRIPKLDDDGKPRIQNGEVVTAFGNGKNYRMRHHGNLTTFEGLVDFRKIVSDRNLADEQARNSLLAQLKKMNRPESDLNDYAVEEADVIKYDYQLMDDAYWLLTENGYKIVKKADSPARV